MNDKNTENGGGKAEKVRSPKYPIISLREALDKAVKIWEKAGRHEIPLESLADYWEISKTSSALIGFSAALVKFGLIEYVSGSGRNKQVKLTQLAIELANHPEGSKERDLALKKAGLCPEIYKDIFEKYQGEFPDDSVIKPYLLIQKNFNKSAVDGFLKNFRETISLAKLDSSDIDNVKQLAEAPVVGAVNKGAETVLPPASSYISIVKSTDSTVIRELPIPLEGGLSARIPFPISEDDFKIILETLDLWKKRIVRQVIKPPDSKEN